jgi:hypothetical protein
VGLLGACGGGAEEPDVAGQDSSPETAAAQDDTSAEPASPEPEAIDIQFAPFCDRVEEALVTDALGGRAKWLDERKPGDEYEVLGTKQVSDRFTCRWQTNAEGTPYRAGDATFAVTIFREPLDVRSARTIIEEQRRGDKRSADYRKCQEAPAPMPADVAYSRVCVIRGDRYNQPSAGGLVTALVGDALLSCIVERAGKDQQAATQQTFKDVCAQVPALLSS